MKCVLLATVCTVSALMTGSSAALDSHVEASRLLIPRRAQGMNPNLNHLDSRDIAYSRHSLVRRGPVRKGGNSKPDSGASRSSLPRADSKQLQRTNSQPSLQASTSKAPVKSGGLRRTDGWMAHGNQPMNSDWTRLPGRLPGRLNADNLGVKRGGVRKVTSPPSSGMHKSATHSHLSEMPADSMRVTFSRPPAGNMPASPFSAPSDTTNGPQSPLSPFAAAALGSSRAESMDWTRGGGGGGGGSSRSSSGSVSSLAGERSSGSPGGGRPPLAPAPLHGAATNLADQMQKMTTQDGHRK